MIVFRIRCYVSHHRKILPVISILVRKRLRGDMLLLNTSRIRGGAYFEYTDIQYSTIDKLISKTIIVYVSVITVPKNVTCHFNLRHMISVHVSALFKQTFHYGGNQYVSVITVPKNMTSTYISHDFSTVHISKRLFTTKSIREKM